MNLGKLLSAGKSIFGGGEPAAYRRNKRVYLPKFNAEKNPFTPKAPEPAPVTAVPETKKVPAPAVAKPAPAPAMSAARPVRATSWTSKLNPFRAPEPVRRAAPNVVQPELSLDAVKVVHNDLAAADIEIVPVKSRTVAPAEAPVLSPSRGAWKFTGEQLVKPV